MKILSKNALLGFLTLSMGVLMTSCDKDGDGDTDFDDKCYECKNSQTNQSEVICSDNFEEEIKKFNINSGDFEGAIDLIDAIPNVDCNVKLF